MLFVQANIGNVCRVALVACSVMNIRSGKAVLGCVTLAGLIAGFACQREWIPRRHADKLDYVLAFINASSGYGIASWPNRLYKVCSVAWIISNMVKACRKQPKVEVDANDAPIPFKLPTAPDVFMDMLPRSEDEFFVHSAHLEIPPDPLPAAPEGVSLTLLTDWYDELDKKDVNFLKNLRDLITVDTHWIDNNSHQSTDQDLIQYVKDGLDQFVSRVSGREDSDEVKRMALLCVQTLEGRELMEKIPGIIQTGIAGHYCPLGFKNEVQLLYSAICNKVTGLSQKIYQALHLVRECEFKQCNTRLHDWIEELFVGSQEDPHAYAKRLVLYGHAFHLHTIDEAIRDLPPAERPDLVSIALARFSAAVTRTPVFYSEYTVAQVVKTTRDLLNAQLNGKQDEREEIVQWIAANVEKQDLKKVVEMDGKGRVKLNEKLNPSVIYDKIFDYNDDYNASIKDKWVYFILNKLSVLAPNGSEG